MSWWWWLRWSLGCVAALVLANALFVAWLSAEVSAEYAAGLRATTDGDSLSIPAAGFFLVTLAVTVAANLCLAVYFAVRKRRTRQRGGENLANSPSTSSVSGNAT
jgi:membrane protein implicated in regulation of membrane protease activity